ncbi:uncharacterized protein ATC70_006843 [Mucor velutinosus]|uniref:DH domain-containing protein n=1 Tax=Mucor velutinosus TaxID=708070 RepID=A0AAN7DR54_9FUNG|nr:hypothetical protein ATC70_006843 [Mucor velutinosus]
MSSIATSSDYDNNNGLWKYPSVTSSAQSHLTSSSASDSFLSMDSFEKETADQLSFITQRSEHFNQLLDDLAIIDEIYTTFEDDQVESEPYERQVADAARNVAQKLQLVKQMCQLEEQHINEMEYFLYYYLEPIDNWIHESSNADIFQKHPGLCSEKALIDLFQITKQITKAHQELFRGLKDRLEMWGPTQFISDIFAHFFERTAAYENYLSICPNTIVTIDTLYKRSSAFTKFMDSCVSRANTQSFKDILFYLKKPIMQISNYHLLITQVAATTEPSHPDYRALVKVQEKFVQRESEWRAITKDRLAHVRVLEANWSITDNPASVTTSRRLYITGLLTRVDISNPQSTQDTRTYLLYNDIFMYCQKIKASSSNTNKKDNKDKLVYKGIINLKSAEITPFTPENLAKISKVKKTSGLGSFMRKSSDAQSQNAAEGTVAVYGFEIHANETSLEGITALRGDGLGVSFHTVPGHKAGNGIKRLYIMRTQTEGEQNAWISLLRKTSVQMTRKK